MLILLNVLLIFGAQWRFFLLLSLILGSFACHKSTEQHNPLTSLHQQARWYLAQNQYQQAQLLYEHALTVDKKILGAEHPAVATDLNRLAEVYYLQGDLVEARFLFQRALAIREKTLGSKHPQVAESLNNLAVLYYTQKRYSLAQPLYERAISINKHCLGQNHPYVARGFSNLARIYQAQGDFAQAQQLYNRALQVFQKLEGNHLDMAETLSQLAQLRRAQNIQPQPLRSHPVAFMLNNWTDLYYTQTPYAQVEFNPD